MFQGIVCTLQGKIKLADYYNEGVLHKKNMGCSLVKVK